MRQSSARAGAGRCAGLGITLAVIATAAVGCAASQQSDTGAAGQGSSGTTGAAGSGAGGAGGCAMPPVVKTAWTFSATTDASSPQLTCAQVGVASVQFFMDAAHVQFDCTALSGTSTAFPAGAYTPRVLLTDAKNTVILAHDLPAVTVPSCGTVNIGTFRFVVPPVSTAGTGGGGVAGTGGGGSGGTSGAAGTSGAGGSTGTAGTGGGTGPCNALPIFAIHSCAAVGACHDAKGTSANFDMASPGWEKNLVGKMPKAGGASGLASACVASGMPYLVAGSAPARGLFLNKLSAAKPVCGAQMPLIPSNLTDSELDCVQRWANALTKP